MKINIIQIGNSKGIRIPASVLNQCHIGTEVEMNIENQKIVIIPVKQTPRQEWAKKFKEMSANNHDSLLIDDSLDIEQEDFVW
jgi:antitoxin MazE